MMMKKLATLLAVTTIAAITITTPVQATEIPSVQIYDSSDLTLEMLQNRNGNIVIEKCLGTVIDEEKNGYLLNPEDPERDYISYKSVEDAEKGDNVVTYFIYNPETNAEDDIIFRFDYIMER